jgi:chorismate synthase
MNSFGRLFQVHLYGESHQKAIGVVIEGVLPGTVIEEAKIEEDLRLRNPVAVGTTPRKEPDRFEITSGVLNGRATGSPIHVIIYNQDIQSKDYEHLKQHPRPGHADFVAAQKFHGFHDPRGGGRFSGRLTAPLVIAGAVAKMTLPYRFTHRLKQVGSLKDMSQLDAYLTEIAAQGDSVGGLIEVVVEDIPVGLGEPMFAKVESLIGQALFSLPAVKGVSIGLGFEGLETLGSAFNDRYEDATGKTLTNHSGGVSGGITNGNPLVVNVFVKPTSSIQKTQQTYHLGSHASQPLVVGGRHDVCIARRAGIVMENMVAVVLADLRLQHESREALLARSTR